MKGFYPLGFIDEHSLVIEHLIIFLISCLFWVIERTTYASMRALWNLFEESQRQAVSIC
jgi:hypothetical protein